MIETVRSSRSCLCGEQGSSIESKEIERRKEQRKLLLRSRGERSRGSFSFNQDALFEKPLKQMNELCNRCRCFVIPIMVMFCDARMTMFSD